MRHLLSVLVAFFALTQGALAQVVTPMMPNVDATPGVAVGSWTPTGPSTTSCDSVGDCFGYIEADLGPWPDSDGFYQIGHRGSLEGIIGDLQSKCKYEVGFQAQGLGLNGGGAPAASDIVVFVGGNTMTFTTDSAAGWENFTFTFFGAAGPNTIAFVAGGFGLDTSLIDGVSVALASDANPSCTDTNPCYGAGAPYATQAEWDAERAPAGDGIGYASPDCDGDGIETCDQKGAPTPCDDDDGDPCLPTPGPECSEDDPLPTLSSNDQAAAAFNAFGSIARHVEYRLGTSGQEHDNYLIQYAFESEDRRLSNGGRWTAAGLSSTQLDGTLSGDGTFAYALAGWDMNEGADSLWGYLLGAEYGDWSYDGEGEVTKLGVSAGIYGGRKLGERGQITGYLTYTHFFNEMTNTLGQTADMQSDRLMALVSLNATLGNAGGLTVKPYLNATYAMEMHQDYAYAGGSSFAGGAAEIGEIGLGAEINLPFNSRWGSAFVRLEANKTFGNEAVTLTNGSVLTPNEDVTGSVGIGWVTNTSYDSIGRLELSVDDLGNDARQNIRLDGHWERNF